METKVILVSEKAAQVIRLVKSAVAKTPTGVSFISVRNYTNKQNETSHYSINIGASYENAKTKDIEFLRALDVTTRTWHSSMINMQLAKDELIAAFLKPNETISKGQSDAYENIGSGLKIHKESGSLVVFGYLKSKTVLVPGEYETKNSRALTIAKDELRKLLRTGKFRQFFLDVNNEIKADKKTLFIEFPTVASII